MVKSCAYVEKKLWAFYTKLKIGICARIGQFCVSKATYLLFFSLYSNTLTKVNTTI